MLCSQWLPCSNYDAACCLQALNCHRVICSVPASLTSYMRAIKSLTNVNLWPQYCSAAPRNHQQAIFLSFTFCFNFHTKQRAFKLRDGQSSCTERSWFRSKYSALVPTIDLTCCADIYNNYNNNYNDKTSLLYKVVYVRFSHVILSFFK